MDCALLSTGIYGSVRELDSRYELAMKVDKLELDQAHLTRLENETCCGSCWWS